MTSGAPVLCKEKNNCHFTLRRSEQWLWFKPMTIIGWCLMNVCKFQWKKKRLVCSFKNLNTKWEHLLGFFLLWVFARQKAVCPCFWQRLNHFLSTFRVTWSWFYSRWKKVIRTLLKTAAKRSFIDVTMGHLKTSSPWMERNLILKDGRRMEDLRWRTQEWRVFNKGNITEKEIKFRFSWRQSGRLLYLSTEGCLHCFYLFYCTDFLKCCFNFFNFNLIKRFFSQQVYSAFFLHLCL